MTENFHPREDEARFQILRSEGGKGLMYESRTVAVAQHLELNKSRMPPYSFLQSRNKMISDLLSDLFDYYQI